MSFLFGRYDAQLKLISYTILCGLLLVGCRGRNAAEQSSNKAVVSEHPIYDRIFIYTYTFKHPKIKAHTIKRANGSTYKADNAICFYQTIVSNDSILLNDPLRRFKESRPTTAFPVDLVALEKALKWDPEWAQKWYNSNDLKRAIIGAISHDRDAEREDKLTKAQGDPSGNQQAHSNFKVFWSELSKVLKTAAELEIKNKTLTEGDKCPFVHPNAVI